MEPTPNAVVAERWNGDSGRNWVAHRERHVVVRRRILPHLWRAPAVRPRRRGVLACCGCGGIPTTAGPPAGPCRALRLRLASAMAEFAPAPPAPGGGLHCGSAP